MAPPCKPLPQAIPLRPTTTGIFSPTAFQSSLIESRSYNLISPSTAFHPLVVMRMSWRDSAIASDKDELIRIESTLIKLCSTPRAARDHYGNCVRLNAEVDYATHLDFGSAGRCLWPAIIYRGADRSYAGRTGR